MDMNFIINAVKSPKVTGTLLPSQKFLIKKLTSPIKKGQCRCILELGAGNGCVTKEILKKIDKNCILLSFEINKNLTKKYKFKNKNLVVINDDVENMKKYLIKYNIKKIDCIVSSLPLAQIKKRKVLRILINANKYLKNEGLYIQYQYSLISLKKLKSVFKEVDIGFTLLNMPPAFVYVCKK